MPVYKKLNTIALSLFIFFIFNFQNTGLSLSKADAAIEITDSVAPPKDQQISFGDVILGDTVDQTVTLTNKGSTDLLIGIITVVFGPPFSIPVNLDNCSNQSVLPEKDCELTVRYTPESKGISRDNVNIPSNDPDESVVTVHIDGRGTITPTPDIEVTDSIAPDNDKSLPFGSIAVGESAEQTVTVMNKGNADLLIGTITSPAAPFRIPASLDHCSGQNVSPGTRCMLKVRFEASINGKFNGAFDIPSNDPDDDLIRVNVGGTRLSSAINALPSAPILVFPRDRKIMSGGDVSFGFNRSSDPDGDRIAYMITICEDANLSVGCTTNPVPAADNNKGVDYAMFGFALVFGSILFGPSKVLRKFGIFMSVLMFASLFLSACGRIEDQSGGGNPSADMIHTVTGLTVGRSYLWQVRADDGFGGIAHSEKRSFTTQ